MKNHFEVFENLFHLTKLEFCLFSFYIKKNDEKQHDEQHLFCPNFDPSVSLRSCEEEVIEPLQGDIRGSVPKWLNGTLLRNGPGKFKVGSQEFKHLFDGSALLHR